LRDDDGGLWNNNGGLSGLGLLGVEGLIDARPNVLADFPNRAHNILSLMENLFPNILNLMRAINCNPFHSLSPIFSSVLDRIGDITNKSKLPKDWSQQ
jgi:hypothetical protein